MNYLYELDKKNKAIITGYEGEETVLNLPAEIDGYQVAGIAAKAFFRNDLIEKVIMPDCIVSVGSEAFYGCVELKEVHISEKVKKMTGNTFGTCVSLQKVNIPDEMTGPVRSLFKDTDLKELTIGKGLKRFDGNMFFYGSGDNGYKRKGMSIDSVKVKPENDNFEASDGILFSKGREILYCVLSEKTELTVPEEVREIHPGAVSGLDELKKITLRAELKAAVENQTEAELDVIGETAPQIEEYEENGVVYRIVNGEKYLVSASSEESVFIVPDDVAHICDSAFAGRGNINRIVIPESIKTIGTNAFPSRNNFIFFDMQSDDEYISLEISEKNENFYIKDDCLICREDSSLVKCFSKDIEIRIPDDVEAIQENAVESALAERIVLPENIKEIGKNAFRNCMNVKNIIISLPNHVESIMLHIPSVLHDAYMNCITGLEHGMFDFLRYDKLFEGVTNDRERVLIAADRLKNPVSISEHHFERYSSILKRYKDEAVKYVIEDNDAYGLSLLGEIGNITEENIEEFIEMANSQKKTEIVSYLIEFKNTRLGVSPFDEFDNWVL